MGKRDIFEEARRRVPLEDRPPAQPVPPDVPLPSLPPDSIADRWLKKVTIGAARYAVGVQVAYGDVGVRKMVEVCKQLHERKGPYYQKWRAAVLRGRGRRRRRR